MLNLLKAWQVNAQNDNFIDAFTNSSTTYFGSLLLTPTKSFVLYVVLSYPVGMVCTYQVFPHIQLVFEKGKCVLHDP